MSKRATALFTLIAVPGLLSLPNCRAEEKKPAAKPPTACFSSQMHDALEGPSKYEKPVWNLHDALKLPEWLDIGLDQRTRYETLDGAFRAGANGGDQQIAMDTCLWLQAHVDAFRVAMEFMDARQFGADQGSGISNNHANEADFLQGYLAWAQQNVFDSGIGAEVIAGRQTINLGSRRLVARNAYRNTMNNFTGIRMRLLSDKHWQLNGFVTMPVLRYPNNSADILDHVHQFDEEDTHTWFSGGFLEIYDLGLGINGELYLYHLDEGDSLYNQTRNRRYFTPGMRVYIKPAKARFDIQMEVVGQVGTVRASTTSTQDQEHEAWFQHLDFGYTFDTAWKPRLGFEYDFASGDKDPNDNKDQRFDTLYGARRFDFGPTGNYGPIARSNISSPGYRISVSPRGDVQAFVGHRFFWLAESKDSWTTANLRDRTGRTDDFIGHQIELSTRWDINSSLNLESGWAHLFKGSFAQNTAGAPPNQDSDYFYVQSMFRF